MINRAAGSFSRIAAALRDEAGTDGDSRAAGRRAAWMDDLTRQVVSLRTLQSQFDADAQLAESESQNFASESLERRADEILRAAQAQLDGLLLELDAKEKTLRGVRRQAEESESKRVTAQRLLAETQKREHQRRLEARNAVDSQRFAEARLRACELELSALKETHEALQYRAGLVRQRARLRVWPQRVWPQRVWRSAIFAPAGHSNAQSPSQDGPVTIHVCLSPSLPPKRVCRLPMPSG